MPVQLDGQLSLAHTVPFGSNPTRAVLVRFTEETLEALAAQLSDPNDRFPKAYLDISDNSQIITIGDQSFPLIASRENTPHDLFRHQFGPSRGSAAQTLKYVGPVTGTFQVQRNEVSKRAQEKLRDRTLLAEQEKAKRHTLYIDAAIDPVTAGKKRKHAAVDNALSKRSATATTTATPTTTITTTAAAIAKRQSQPIASTSTPVSSAPASSSSAGPKVSRIPSNRGVDIEQRVSQPAPRPKLAKAAAAPPMRSSDGSTLTSNFRGGVLARETKKAPTKSAKEKAALASTDPPAPRGSKPKIPRDWDGEPDDIPLAIATKAAAPKANGRPSTTATAAKPRDSVGTSSSTTKATREHTTTTTTLSNGRKAAVPNGSAAVSAPAPVPVNGSASARPSAAASKKATQESAVPKRKKPVDDGDDEYAPGSRKPTQRTAGAATTEVKRKRPVDDGDDEYAGPGASKKRKSIAAPGAESHAPTSSKLTNGSAKRAPEPPKRSPQPPPPPPKKSPQPPALSPLPPPVTKLAKANEDRQLKGLKFNKKEERKPEVLTPKTASNTTPTSLPPAPPPPAPAPAPTPTTNGVPRRRNTPTFTSTEDDDDDDEEEEGELRPQKKQRTSHSHSHPHTNSHPHSHSAPTPRKWQPQSPLPTNHAALRALYHETYVEYSACQLAFATQRHLLTRLIEHPTAPDDGKADASVGGGLMDEAALQQLVVRFELVVKELNQIRDVLGIEPVPSSSSSS